MNDSNAVLFNHQWRFIWGDPPHAEGEECRDSSWKLVNLPHDAVISRPYRSGGPAGSAWTEQNMQGFFAWKGVMWYRKRFTLPPLRDRRVFLRFGGAYRQSDVFVNGERVGGRAYGYSSFELEITKAVREGENLAAVRLDNTGTPERWYSGAGLYRNVALVITCAARIPAWGVRVMPSLDEGGGAKVRVETEVESGKPRRETNAVLTLEILSPEGRTAATARTPVAFTGEKTLVTQDVVIKRAALWSAETPKMYRAVVKLSVPSADHAPLPATQTVSTTFGLREAAFAYGRGFAVNGQTVKLRGVCLHLEGTLLGAAYRDEVWRRNLLSLKALGCNAVRTSHNPPAEEFLDLCDELGFYVIDECFDKWTSGSYGPLFEANWKRDLADFVRRDRNHPCVVLWSVGNEVEGQGEAEMLKIQRKLCEAVRALDSRPVTCAWAPHAVPRTLVGAPVKTLVARTKKLAASVDVLGLNYHEDLFAAYTAGIEKPIVATECYEYYTGTANNFEDIIEKNPWAYALENDNVAGQFIWAGIDYFGEASARSRGWAGAILDITGYWKPNAYFRKCLWSAEPEVFIGFPDTARPTNYARGRWSFPKLACHLNNPQFGHDAVSALVFTNCEEVELVINDKVMGRRRPADFDNGVIRWTFEYTEGKIAVNGYRGGRLAASRTLETAGEAARVALRADDSAKVRAGELVHVEVEIVDAQGRRCPNERSLVEFALEGDAEIAGCAAGDLTDPAFAPTLPRVTTADGRALVIVKCGESGGAFKLSAYSGTLQDAELAFSAQE